VTGETDLETVRISDGRGVNLHYDLADAADVEDVLSELIGLIRDGALPPDAFTYPGAMTLSALIARREPANNAVAATAPEEHADALTVCCAAILTKPYTAAQLEEVLAARVTCAVAPRFGLT